MHKAPRAHWLLITSIYITQSLGMAFLSIALIAIMRERGADLADLSWIYLLGLPWIFKFLWAPLIDRFNLPWRGHYRSWLLLMQGLMVCCLLWISQLSLDEDMHLIAIAGFIFVCCSATQDIAGDALATILFSHRQHGMVNGIQTAGGFLGNLIGSGLVLLIYSVSDWATVFYFLAALTTVCWLQIACFREPEAQQPIVRPTIRQIGIAQLVLWRKQWLWLLLLITMPMAFCLANGILTPMLIDGGWALTDIGLAMNGYGAIVGVIAALASGRIIAGVARHRAIMATAIVQIIGLVAILPLTYHVTPITAYLALTAFFIVYPCVVATLSTLMMDNAAPSDCPGSIFTVQYSVYMLVGFGASALALNLAAAFGYRTLILLAIVISIIAFFIAILLIKGERQT
ncbi:MFS transporter [Cardiobacteriaceae bacterium TAE3-ERU3]|nr:MFS transporter [Cardiobacteriaceae bacterium TAE3-ERU3]